MPKTVIDYNGPGARAAFIAGVECEALHCALTDPAFYDLGFSTQMTMRRAWTMWDSFRRETKW